MGQNAHPPHRKHSDDRPWPFFKELNAEWDFLWMLRDEGRRCAELNLTAHAADLGACSALDLHALLK